MTQVFPVLLAIICVTILEAGALWAGLDGVLFGGAVATIAGLGGWTLHRTDPATNAQGGSQEPLGKARRRQREE